MCSMSFPASFTVRGMDVVSGPLVGPTRQWERGKSLLPHRNSSRSGPSVFLAAALPTPPLAAIGVPTGELHLGHSVPVPHPRNRNRPPVTDLSSAGRRAQP
jgi:hypothetical protein